jgi:hypothetical protein
MIDQGSVEKVARRISASARSFLKTFRHFPKGLHLRKNLQFLDNKSVSVESFPNLSNSSQPLLGKSASRASLNARQ